MDPSCKDDFHVVFKQLVPCHMELDYETSSHHMQTTENIYFRILVQGEECRPEAIKLELTTDADVQLFYQCLIKPMSNNRYEDFTQLVIENNLSVEFEGLVGMLKSLLQDSV